MAKITTTKYVCDVCKAELDDEKALKSTPVLGRGFDCEGRGWAIEEIRVDMCDQCRRRLFDLIFSKYAEVDSGYSVTVKRKDKE